MDNFNLHGYFKNQYLTEGDVNIRPYDLQDHSDVKIFTDTLSKMLGLSIDQKLGGGYYNGREGYYIKMPREISYWDRDQDKIKVEAIFDKINGLTKEYEFEFNDLSDYDEEPGERSWPANIGFFVKEKSVNETDINDPVLMKMRAAKDAIKNKKPDFGKEYGDAVKIAYGNDKNVKKLAFLKKEREQLMRDMEQEAEPEGGPIADEYGSKLNRIDKAIAKLSGRKEMTYDQAIAEDETYASSFGGFRKELDGETIENELQAKGYETPSTGIWNKILVNKNGERVAMIDTNESSYTKDGKLYQWSGTEKFIDHVESLNEYKSIAEMKVGDKVTFKSGGGEMEIIGIRDMFASDLKAYRVKNADGETFEYSEDQLQLKESDSNYPDFDLNKNIKYKDTSISSGMWRYTGQEQGGAGVYRNLNNGQILAFDRSDFDIFRNNLSNHFDISESLNEYDVHMPSQEEVDKFFALTNNETHYLNSKPVMGQEKTFNKMEVEPWDEYDYSNWKALVGKAKQQGKLDESASTEEKRIAMRAIKSIAKYRGVSEDEAKRDLTRAIEQLGSLKEAIKDIKETIELGKNLTEELCAKGKAYRKKRMAAGEKSSAYLNGRAVKVCKGQMKG